MSTSKITSLNHKSLDHFPFILQPMTSIKATKTYLSVCVCLRERERECVPVVHRGERHGAVHVLSGRRRGRGLVWPTQGPAPVGHGCSPEVVFTPQGGVSQSHLGSQDAGRRARVGVGVACMVHGTGVVEIHMFQAMTPEKERKRHTEKEREGETDRNIKC